MVFTPPKLKVKVAVIFKKGTYGIVGITSCVGSETLHKMYSLEPARPLFLVGEVGVVE